MSEKPVRGLNADDAAHYIGVSRRTLERERRAGRICARYQGTKPLYLIEELDEWLDSLPSEPKGVVA